MPPKLTKSEARIRKVRIRAARQFQGQFLDAWFELRPIIYNKSFDLNDGNGDAMVEEFRSLNPGLFRVIAKTAALKKVRR